MTTTPMPILDAVFNLADNKRSGTLILGSDKNTIELHFRNGEIRAASSDLPDFQIGRFLSKKGFIKKPGIVYLLKESRKKRLLLGEAAVKDRILNNDELSDIIQDQIVQLIMHALNSGFEVQNFSLLIKPLYLPARLSSKQLVLDLARRNVQPLEPDPQQRMILSNGHGFADVFWYPQELSVIGELKNPRTIQELAISTGLEHSRLCKILAVLKNLRMITSIEDTETETTAVSTLNKDPEFEAIVPEIHKTSLNPKLDVFHNPSSFISEQFKTLKVRLNEFSSSRPGKVITVSSPYNNEGKSLVCANLGLCFAKDPDRRVILIDCDLRNPSIHRYFGVSMGPGLHGHLKDDSLQPYCYMRRVDRLFIMTAGEVSSDPIELLAQDKMKRLLEHLKLDFDIVIIDTPPMGLVSDAQVMTDLSDGLILVVRSSRTTYRNLERSFKTLDQSKLLGIVLNDVQPRMFNTEYDYRYYQYGNQNVYPYGKSKTKTPRRTYFE